MSASRKRQVLANRLFFMTFTARAQKATRSSPRRSSPMPRNALGRGLGALIREPEPKTSPEPTSIHPQATTASGAASAPARDAVHPGPQQVDIDLIEPSPYQPRTRFREEALDELALEMTLVENIQREDLNAIEAARAFERLMDESQLTQEAVAERTGKDRATVANAIRLLKLEPTIQDWIEEGKLTAGHGRALLAVPDPQLRMRYAQRAARGGLTVRQIEKLASRRSRGAHAPAELHPDANIRSALDELQRHLGTKVLLHQKTKMRPGQLVLEYYDDAQLMGLYDRLMK